MEAAIAEQFSERDTDDQRKHELRKAGKEFLERALAQATQGKDPFKCEPIVSKTERAALQRTISDDPDVAAFGAIFEGTLLYVMVVLYVAAQASTLVFLKGCLLSMATPATLTFLHMLPVALATWLMGSHEMVTPPQMSFAAVKGSCAKAVLQSLQVLLMVCALFHTSVYLVLSWTCAMPLLLEALAGHKLFARSIPDAVKVPMGVALCGALLELLFDAKRSFLGLMLLLLWTAAKCGEYLWQYLKIDATAGGRILDLQLSSTIQDISLQEDQLDRSTFVFMSNALPAAPVLILGFIFLEGQELVDHELSVPAVTVMLLSILAYTIAASTQLLLDDKLASEHKVLAKGMALLGTIVLDFLERAHALGTMCLIGVVMAALGSVVAGWVARQARGQQAARAPAAGSAV